jgi:hypothetical protein
MDVGFRYRRAGERRDRAIGTRRDTRLIDVRASRFQRIKRFENTATAGRVRQKSPRRMPALSGAPEQVRLGGHARQRFRNYDRIRTLLSELS